VREIGCTSFTAYTGRTVLATTWCAFLNAVPGSLCQSGVICSAVEWTSGWSQSRIGVGSTPPSTEVILSLFSDPRDTGNDS
jgi:hypothetical protein